MFHLPTKLITHTFAALGLKLSILVLVITIGVGGYFYNQKTHSFDNQVANLLSSESNLKTQLSTIEKELNYLKNVDQVKKNAELEGTIKSIEETYQKAVLTYEKILDYKGAATSRTKFDTQLAKALKLLSERNYGEAQKELDSIEKAVSDEQTKVTQAAIAKIPENVAQSNTPPGSGHSRQKVVIDIGEYLVDIVTADLGSTRVIVDSASDSDCRDNCPVLPLADYVSRSGAFAGVNGSYFCPATYPSCVGKTNSFDTLLMNKNKKYINSDNNVYSNVPAVIFSGSSARYVTTSSQWGRDTSVDSVLANHPLLLSGGEVVFGGNSDPKQGSKGSRSFVGTNGSTVYIGVVHGATVAEVARVLKGMDLRDALNLDSGGSTALWSGGYKVGPGRNIPNSLLFVRR